jgi:hypothetical protein
MMFILIGGSTGCNGKATRNNTTTTTFNIENSSGGGTFTVSSMNVVNPSVTFNGNSHVTNGTYRAHRSNPNHWHVTIEGNIAYATLQNDQITMLFHN